MDDNGRTERHIRRSETIGKLAEALAKAQGDIKHAVKDSDNPFYRSKYADLAGVADACRAPLSANGLAVMQFPRGLDGAIEVETLLAHSSGEWVSETLWLPANQMGKDGKDRFDPQTVGSAITYARRYALAAIVGVCPEDDDGNSASRASNEAKVDLRSKALAILEPAAKQGREQFGLAWKTVSPAMRDAVKQDVVVLKSIVEAVEKKGGAA